MWDNDATLKASPYYFNFRPRNLCLAAILHEIEEQLDSGSQVNKVSAVELMRKIYIFGNYCIVCYEIFEKNRVLLENTVNKFGNLLFANMNDPRIYPNTPDNKNVMDWYNVLVNLQLKIKQQHSDEKSESM